jgi:hypothetical protein
VGRKCGFESGGGNSVFFIRRETDGYPGCNKNKLTFLNQV